MMNIKRMICCAFLAAMCTSSFAQDQEEWKLVWSDEFNINGRPDSTVWNYEIGFQRNHEDQWYQPANAYCKGGCLVIEAKKEKKERKNPAMTRIASDGHKMWKTSAILLLSSILHKRKSFSMEEWK